MRNYWDDYPVKTQKKAALIHFKAAFLLLFLNERLLRIGAGVINSFEKIWYLV